MDDEFYGRIVKQLREEKRLTQEELAHDICAVSTLSKIENGSRVPNRYILNRLMEKLGISDFSINDIVLAQNTAIKRARDELLEALRLRNYKDMDEKLLAYRDLLDDKATEEERNFYELAKMLWIKGCGETVADFTTKCMEMLNGIMPAGRRVTDYCTLELNPLQRLFLNNCGLGYLMDNDPTTAFVLFSLLMINITNCIDDMPKQNKAKAVVCNNMALCQLMLGREDKAMELCNRGIEFAVMDGDCELWLQLYKTKMRILSAMDEYDEMYRVKLFLSRAYGIASKGRINGRTLEDFLSEPEGISIL